MRLTPIFVGFTVLLSAAAQESFHTKPPPISPDFSCAGRRMGYYADAGTNCRAYHTCDDHGNHFAHYCPEDTAFRQDAMICDHAYKVDCKANIESAGFTGFGEDSNHQSPPSDFVELRGEGSDVRGFTRSFRINPDAKSSSGSKTPSFVLTSSVFLKESKGRPTDATLRSQEPEIEASQTTITKKDYTHNPFLSTLARGGSSENLVSTTIRTTISEELQPPPEATNTKNAVSYPQEEDYSFLQPPLFGNENQKGSFESFRNNHFESGEMPSIESFSGENESSDIRKDSFESVTFSPRTERIFDMMRSRAISEEVNAAFQKPVNFLLPPIFKSEPKSISRANLHGDDFPYVETLRSIQNNRPATGSTTPTPLRIRVTEAAIFPVPTKSLASADSPENDPYYPRTPTTTEAYYTPRHQGERPRKPNFTTTRRPHVSNVRFEIPPVLPDLNSLEDLVDRRKFFFIPQVKAA